ncbi:hypothetical protein L596_010551 [Steinernema carpocapsae]|uniref:Uncharacterized protein n=1 Tax=Steinernema carpocapsae TaxID=34508 RepID=A0A4U5PIZ3_STECR|nr:hypothetical protein L596_010551 [Steinernema carpocapsae]
MQHLTIIVVFSLASWILGFMDDCVPVIEDSCPTNFRQMYNAIEEKMLCCRDNGCYWSVCTIDKNPCVEGFSYKEKDWQWCFWPLFKVHCCRN